MRGRGFGPSVYAQASQNQHPHPGVDCRLSCQMTVAYPYRALVIDDDPLVHELFNSMLPVAAARNGASSGLAADHFAFQIDSAFQGEDGVNRARSASSEGRPYSLAFVDLRMPPGLDGMETISRLWNQFFDLQIVICTGNADYSWEEINRRFGHSDRLQILRKPFDVAQVRQIAYSLAEKWNLSHQAQGHLERLQRLVSERTAKLQKANLALQRKIFQNQQTERRLVTQMHAGRVLAEVPAVPEAIKSILQIVSENLGWDWAAFWRLEEEPRQLRFHSHWTRNDTQSAEFLEVCRQSNFESGADLPGRVWAEASPVWLQEFDPSFPRAAGASRQGFHSAVGFPIYLGSELFGVMEFASREILERDPDQLQTFAFIAGALGQLIERKRAEEERKLMEIQLRQAQKLESIGQLAAGIAHEINTPTQYIGDNIRFLQASFAELESAHHALYDLMVANKSGHASPSLIAGTEASLARTDLGFLLEEIPKAVAQTLEGVDRVAKIVRAMKDFSHPGTGEKVLVNLNHALDTTLTVARNEWKYVAKVETDFDPALPSLPCLPGELNQVLLNLIVNAAHAIADVVADDAERKGVITASTRSLGEWAEIRIKDTGRGIPEQIRHKIYDPFFTTKPVGKGTGQGLAIAHAVIVDQHGGTLSFETEMGVGTTFIIRLPFKPASGKPAKPKAARLLSYETSTFRRR